MQDLYHQTLQSPGKAVADASVESLNQRAQRALATGKGRLVNSAGEVGEKGFRV